MLLEHHIKWSTLYQERKDLFNLYNAVTEIDEIKGHKLPLVKIGYIAVTLFAGMFAAYLFSSL